MEKSEENIFKITRDEERAKDLLNMAKERLEIIIKSIPRSVPYKLLEEFYEIVIQLITALMYADGYKTLSHIELVRYLKRYKKFDSSELEILDKMRKFRHGTVYYGRKESGNFFINHEGEIKNIVKKLVPLVETKLKGNS